MYLSVIRGWLLDGEPLPHVLRPLGDLFTVHPGFDVSLPLPSRSPVVLCTTRLCGSIAGGWRTGAAFQPCRDQMSIWLRIHITGEHDPCSRAVSTGDNTCGRPHCSYTARVGRPWGARVGRRCYPSTNRGNYFNRQDQSEHVLKYNLMKVCFVCVLVQTSTLSKIDLICKNKLYLILSNIMH